MTKMKKRKPKTLTTPRFRRAPPSLLPPEFPRIPRAALVGLSVWLCLALTASPSAGVQASQRADESSYALIFGTVWGPSGLPLYGVKVKVRRSDQKKARWELYSDHRGEFAQRVPAGKADYVLWADMKGYKNPGGKPLESGPQVTVHIENNERVDTGLHLK
jgi:hypothetical protein